MSGLLAVRDQAYRKEWATFLTQWALCLVFPTKQVRKGGIVRVPPTAPGGVLRLGPQSLMLCLPLIRNLLFFSSSVLLTDELN